MSVLRADEGFGHTLKSTASLCSFDKSALLVSKLMFMPANAPDMITMGSLHVEM